jgi:integrase
VGLTTAPPIPEGERSMSIYNWPTKKGKSYYWQFMVNGRYIRSQGKGFETYADALKDEGKHRNMAVHPDRLLFSELFQKYMEYIKAKGQSDSWIHEKEMFLEKNCKTWFNSPISKIRRFDVEQELQKRTPKMANNFLTIVKAVFTYAEKMEFVVKSPCKGIEMRSTEEPKRYVVPVEDFLKVIEVADLPNQQFLKMLFLTGARYNELLSLTWENVFENHLVLHSKKHAGGDLRGRKVPLCEMAIQIIGDLKNSQNNGFVFLSRVTVNRYFSGFEVLRKLCKQAKVTPFGHHSIRRLSASVMCREGTSIKDISSILGHQQISTTSLYLSSIGQGVKEAVNKLQDVLEQFNNEVSPEVKPEIHQAPIS